MNLLHPDSAMGFFRYAVREGSAPYTRVTDSKPDVIANRRCIESRFLAQLGLADNKPLAGETPLRHLLPLHVQDRLSEPFCHLPGNLLKLAVGCPVSGCLPGAKSRLPHERVGVRGRPS